MLEALVVGFIVGFLGLLIGGPLVIVALAIAAWVEEHKERKNG